MYSKAKLTQTLAKLGNYEAKLISQTDPRGRKFYSGFITNKEQDITIYLNSESYYNAHCDNKFLVRYAKRIGDYKGGINHFVSPQDSPYLIHQMLKSKKQYEAEIN